MGYPIFAIDSIPNFSLLEEPLYGSLSRANTFLDVDDLVKY